MAVWARFFGDDPIAYRAAAAGSDTDSGAGSSSVVRKVLVVDDEHLVADTIVEILNQSGFDAVAAYSGPSALQVAAEVDPDILLTDVLMPNINGVQLAIRMFHDRPAIKVVLISGQTGISSIIESARAAGYAFDLLPKPIHPQMLLRKLRE